MTSATLSRDFHDATTIAARLVLGFLAFLVLIGAISAVIVGCGPAAPSDLRPPDAGACGLATAGAAFACPRGEIPSPACVEAAARAAVACSPTP